MVSFFVTPVLFLNLFVPTVSAAGPSTISELVELLITIGVIAPNKAVSARAAVASLSQVHASTSTVPVTSSGPLPYIQVLSPNGSEKWEMGVDVAYSIKWGSAGLSVVNLALVNSKNNLCVLNQSPVISRDGVNTFNLLLKDAKCYATSTATTTLLKSGTYKVRVYYTDSLGNTIKDESNAVFSIIPELLPTLKVVYPNGSETLIRNNDYVVKYSLKNAVINDNLIYLLLIDNAGLVAYSGHKTVTSAGTYNLELPSNLTPNAYKVKLTVTTNDHIKVEDTSDNFFWISSSN